MIPVIRFSWDSTAPLMRPVVPEVKRIAAGSLFFAGATLAGALPRRGGEVRRDDQPAGVAALAQQRRAPAVGENDGGRHIVDRGAKLARRPAAVEQRGDAAAADRRQKPIIHSLRFAHADGDAVAAFDAEDARQRVAALEQLGEGQIAVAFGDERSGRRMRARFRSTGSGRREH